MLKVDHAYWKMPYLKSAELEFLQIRDSYVNQLMKLSEWEAVPTGSTHRFRNALSF